MKNIGIKASKALDKLPIISNGVTFKVTAKSAAFISKAAAGPVGWAFAVFDGISTIMDLYSIGGYDNVQTIQHWLTERENTKHEAYERMEHLLKHMQMNQVMNFQNLI